MNTILSAVNALQLISHLPMLDILLTENVYLFLGEMQAVVGWDIYNPFTNVQEFTPTLPLYQRFELIGYSSSNYFENVGSIALLQLLFLARVLMNPFLHMLNNCGVKKVINMMSMFKLGRVELCNAVIMVFMSFYMEMLIGALIALNMYQAIKPEERTGADQFTMTFAMITFLPVLAFPLFVSWYTLYHSRWLTETRRRDMLIKVFDRHVAAIESSENEAQDDKKVKNSCVTCIDKLCGCLDYKPAKQLSQPVGEKQYDIVEKAVTTEGVADDHLRRLDTDRKMLGNDDIQPESKEDGGMEPDRPREALTALATQLNERVQKEVEVAKEDGGH